MSAAHTPAPWVSGDEFNPFAIYAENGYCVARCTPPRGDYREEVRVVAANLALLTTAPRLLEALRAAEVEIRALSNACGEGLMTAPTLAAIRAAIAQATRAAS